MLIFNFYLVIRIKLTQNLRLNNILQNNFSILTKIDCRFLSIFIDDDHDLR